MVRWRYVVLPMSLLAVLPGCGHRQEPQRVAAAWCKALVDQEDATALSLMGADLRRLVEQARAADAAFRARNPGEKPPLGDGLRLTSFPDALDGCEITGIAGSVATVRLLPAGAPDGSWQDRLYLKADGTKLRVDDVGFAPDGRDRLRPWLAEAIRTGYAQQNQPEP